MDGFNKAAAVAAEDSDEEEVFLDADRDDQVRTKEKVERTTSEYDSIKIEPKYANAENAPLWELATLARHCHPTICKWAEALLQGKPVEYVGDPLLDFSIANFLDRVSYKNPKASDKIDQFRKRMASYEKPINQIDFGAGEEPEVERQEEEFMYKFMKMRGPLKSKPTVKVDENGDEMSDSGISDFA